MDIQIAREFLMHCFYQGETIAFLLRAERPTKLSQRIVTLEAATSYRYLAWLSHQNNDGANVYVAANPLRTGSLRRTKQSIDSVRHLYIDIDTDGETRIAALRASNAVPTPNVILNTSPGKYQALWRVVGFDFFSQESALKSLAIAFGGDPACTDCNRVLRVPGFTNHKYDPAHPVSVEYPRNSVCGPSDFHLDPSEAAMPLSFRDLPPRKPASKYSNSESDWAWVSSELRKGREAVKLTRELAVRRSDKSDPVYYAQRTVDMASAHLWIIDGVPISDVITMLDQRRRFEIPAATCLTRAREIAATAERMAVRHKIA
jgi:hypothetical protein